MPAECLRLTLIELLESAERALSVSETPARSYIVKAARLLREEDAWSRTGSTGSDYPSTGRLLRWQMQRITRYVEANAARRIVVANLATVAGFSVRHFSFAFRATTGISPHTYVTRYRIQRAQALMLSTQRTLSEIALECGLADQAHLTRIFKFYVGKTPARWRRMQRAFQKDTAVHDAPTGTGQNYRTI
jgi:AraC family transcriptional regulator